MVVERCSLQIVRFAVLRLTAFQYSVQKRELSPKTEAAQTLRSVLNATAFSQGTELSAVP